MAVALARWLLGALLIWAGAFKVGHPETLASAIAGFRLLPPGVVAPLAVILPYFEILLGLYLIAGLFTRAAGWVAMVQFVVYAGAIASAVLRGIPANCGCLGPGYGGGGLAARSLRPCTCWLLPFLSPCVRLERRVRRKTSAHDEPTRARHRSPPS